MKIAELGEFGLIDRLAGIVDGLRDGRIPSWQQAILSIGDDAAAWRGDTATQLATADCLIQDIHFSLETTSWADLGWKAMAVNLSDIAAMGGLPRYALVSLALPGDTEVDDVTALYQGMAEMARQHGVAIVGGDTSRAPMLVIAITVIGVSGNPDNRILTRSGAVPGEQIAVTGYLGAAAGGLEMVTNKLHLPREITARLEQKFRRPCPRVTEGQILLEQGVKTAIDTSDGLIADLGHICAASEVGARIDVDRVPAGPELKEGFGDQARELALAGGEDYELLFTGSPEVITRVKQAAPCLITVVGQVTADKESGVTLADGRGQPFHLKKTGWEHFTTKD